MSQDSNEISKGPPPVEAVGLMVNDRSLAVYGPGFSRATRQFIETLDASFWEHQLGIATSIPIEQITHDQVTLVRLALSHAEETLFAYIFAFLQAPHCPDIWLYLYKNEDIHILVNKVEENNKFLTRFGLNQITWIDIAKALWPGLEDKRYALTALALGRLAKHFLSTEGKDVYNGLKHGMRLSFGGTSISFSPGGSPDKMPPPESYIRLGDSKYGSRSWTFENIPGSKGHLRAKLFFSNWDFMELGYHLTHATLLIGNMGAAFRVYAKVEGDREFKFFTGDAAYEDNPRKQQGMVTGELSATFDLPKSKLLNLEDIRKLYS
jgi:hypothetical protein